MARLRLNLLFLSLFFYVCAAYGTENAKKVLVLGDSLSAGYGIDVRVGWVNLLSQRLKAQGKHQVINASISGETSRGGLHRLPTLLKKHTPDIVIIELGGNDGLGGHPIKVLRKNLTAITQSSLESGARVLLLGMQIPPNYGQRYTQLFANVYPEISQSLNVPLVPFFLESVALNKALMQKDGIHPNASAQPILLKNIFPYLQPLLSRQ